MPNLFHILGRDGMLFAPNGTPIANFELQLVTRYYLPGHSETPAALSLQVLHLGRQCTVVIDLRRPHPLSQLTNAIKTCMVLQPAWYACIEAYILAFQSGESEASQTHLFFAAHGLHHLGIGQWVYVSGDEILNLPSEITPLIASSVSHLHLDWSPDLPQLDAITSFCGILRRYPAVYLPVWGYTIASSLRSCLASLDVPTFPPCAIIGGQSFGKTTLVHRLMLLYHSKDAPGIHWGELDTCTTEAAAIDAICQCRDQVVLLDDMTAGTSHYEAQRRKSLVQSISRFAANGSSRSKMLGRKSVVQCCDAGLVYTGEYSLVEPSQITRLLCVRIDQQLTGGSEQDRTIAATVLHFLLLWLLPKLDEQLEHLRIYLESISDGKQLRLWKNRMLILWALELFWQFAAEQGAITEEYQNDAMQNAQQILDDIVSQQISAVTHAESFRPMGNIPWYILGGYKNGAISVVENREHIKTRRDCVVEKDCLCIQWETLLQYLSKYLPGRVPSKKTITELLVHNGILATPKEEGRYAGKRIYGQRYLELDLCALKKSAKRY